MNFKALRQKRTLPKKEKGECQIRRNNKVLFAIVQVALRAQKDKRL